MLEYYLQILEELLLGTMRGQQNYVPYFRWYVAHSLFQESRVNPRGGEEMCLGGCKFATTGVGSNKTFIRCKCGKKFHNTCVGRKANCKDEYVCQFCEGK